MLEYNQSFFLYSASLPMQAALRMYTPQAVETPSASTSLLKKNTDKKKPALSFLEIRERKSTTEAPQEYPMQELTTAGLTEKPDNLQETEQ